MPRDDCSDGEDMSSGDSLEHVTVDAPETRQIRCMNCEKTLGISLAGLTM